MGGQLVTRGMAEAGGEREANAYFKERAMVQSTMGMSQDQAGKFIEIMASVREQGGVATKEQQAALDGLKKTETDWAADTYKIEDEMRQKMDLLYNNLAPAGGTIKKLIEGMSATVITTGASIVSAVLGAAAMSGVGNLLGGGFKGAARGAIGGRGGAALSRNIFKNTGALKGIGKI